MNNTTRNYLSEGQVHALNEKHGWFEFRDAQGDVSRDFSQDAIALHESIRAAAPELLAVLQEIISDGIHCDVVTHLHVKALAVIAKATGANAKLRKAPDCGVSPPMREIEKLIEAFPTKLERKS